MTTPQSAQPQWQEGFDGDSQFYREVIRPGVGAWLAVGGLALMLGVAYIAALGPVAGAVALGGIGGLGAWFLIRQRAVVRVDDRVVRAGQARLPLRYVGRVRSLDADQSAEARSSGADANAYLVLRVGYAKESVAIEVTDPRDPHTYWLVSTRHPEQLVSAIMDATKAATGTTPAP